MPLDTNIVVKNLIAKNKELIKFNKQVKLISGNDIANNFITDINNYPHAFVIGCIMNRQINAEKAWMIVFSMKNYLEKEGLDFNIETLYQNNNLIYNWIIKFSGHRYSYQIAKSIIYALEIINTEYNGDASKIWKTADSCEALIYRFSKFKGIGQKISTMATNILVRDFNINLPQKSYIDISIDVHVKRVFTRIFYGNKDINNEEIIKKARQLNPEYPGALDLPLFTLGQLKICSENKPKCNDCYLEDLCIYSISK